MEGETETESLISTALWKNTQLNLMYTYASVAFLAAVYKLNERLFYSLSNKI